MSGRKSTASPVRLIARFIDKDAEFLYVAAADVLKVAEASGAIPYDIPTLSRVWTPHT